MKRLTSRRVNGIKTGYWTTAKKDDLVQRLGQLEDLAECSAWMPARRPPEDDKEVLIVTQSKNGSRSIDKGYYLHDQERWVHRGTAEVTHWTLLPALPEVVPDA